MKSYNFKIPEGITLDLEIRNRPLVSLLHKELLQLSAKTNKQQTKNPIQKWAKDLTRSLSKDYIQVAKKHEKIFSIISRQRNVNQNHGEIPLRVTRITKIKKTDNSKCW